MEKHLKKGRAEKTKRERKTHGCRGGEGGKVENGEGEGKGRWITEKERGRGREGGGAYPNPLLFFVSLSRTTKADLTGPISEKSASRPSLFNVNGRFLT